MFLKQVPSRSPSYTSEGDKSTDLGSSQVMLNCKMCLKSWFMSPKHCLKLSPGNQTWSSPKENRTEMQAVRTAGPCHQYFALHISSSGYVLTNTDLSTCNKLSTAKDKFTIKIIFKEDLMKQNKRLYRKEMHAEPAKVVQGGANTGHQKYFIL